KAFVVRGATRGRSYVLRSLDQWERIYSLEASLEEHLVWRNDIVPRIGQLTDNVSDIWHHGFTEILNNAIEHSSGGNITIQLVQPNPSPPHVVVQRSSPTVIALRLAPRPAAQAEAFLPLDVLKKPVETRRVMRNRTFIQYAAIAGADDPVMGAAADLDSNL
ncbi:MAG: hypothetical protein ACRESZ_20585, partial [Methylococcales bacterium]